MAPSQSALRSREGRSAPQGALPVAMAVLAGGAALASRSAFVLPSVMSQQSEASAVGEASLAQLRGAAKPADFDVGAQAAPSSCNAAVGLAAALAGAAAGITSRATKGRQHRGVVTPRTALNAVRQLRPRDRKDGHGWIKEDPEFTDTDESIVSATHTVELKKRPSGIKRYTHGADGQGAMVMDLNEKPRYPGDPLGQAAVAGVKKGYVVKSVGGVDVRGWDFEDIMDLLEDYVPDPDVSSTAAFGGGAKRERKHAQVEFPVVIEYMELKEGAASAAKPKAMEVPKGAWMPRLSGWEDKDLAAERVRVKSLPEPGADYKGPRYSGGAAIDDAWLKQLMDMQKDGKLLPKKDVYLMVLDVIDLLKKEATLVDVKVASGQTLTVFGDLHGQYFDFLNMLSSSGLPSPAKPFLFNGDFVDRGSWSIEVIMLIFAFKLRYPGSVFMNRGNHEMLETNLIYGFAGEVGSKYDMGLFDLFSESFRNLPLTHLVNNEVLVVHAGLPGPMPRVWLPGQTHDPEDAVPVNAVPRTLAEIRAVDRYTELSPNSFKAAVDDAPRKEEKWESDQRMIIDFLWADPRGGAGYGPSYRKSKGVFMFGPDVTDQFCKANNVKLVIRSHEVKSEGFKYDHSNLLAVFSAPNYLDTGGNKGAYLQLSPTGPGGSLAVTPTSFAPVPHPALKPMHYQEFIVENHPHLTRTMKKKKVSMEDDFGDGDFAGYQGPDEWEEA